MPSSLSRRHGSMWHEAEEIMQWNSTYNKQKSEAMSRNQSGLDITIAVDNKPRSNQSPIFAV